MLSELNIFGYIGKRYSWTEDKLVGVNSEDVQQFLLNNATASEINVNINTLGGSTFEGIAIHSLLRQFATQRKSVDPSFKLRTVNLAAALSAGSIIFLAGDERVSLIGSQVMVHCCHGEVAGNANDLRQMADSYDTTDTAVAEMYAATSGKKSAKEFLEIMRNESWFTAESSVELGLSTAVDTGREAPKMDFPFERGSYKQFMADVMLGKKRESKAKVEPVIDDSAERRRKEFAFHVELLKLASA